MVVINDNDEWNGNTNFNIDSNNNGLDKFFLLPDSLMVEVLDYLRLKDRRMILSSCRFLWRMRWIIERNQTVLDFAKNLEESERSRLLLLFPSSTPPSHWTINNDSMNGNNTAPFNAYGGELTTNNYNIIHMNSVWLYFSGFQNVIELNLGQWATDAFLELISQNNPLPKGQLSTNSKNKTQVVEDEGTKKYILLERLECLSMRHSLFVTDKGLLAISLGGSVRSDNLKSIDITFCRNTTYYGTFPLREKLKNLSLIRRQPEWMDGTYITPFDDDSNSSQNTSFHNNRSNTESHTYWADGSFSFSRSTQSSGFVCDLIDWSKNDSNYGDSNNSTSHHVGDKLQYNDFLPPEGWPSWTRYYYRPGVSLLKLPDEEETTSYAMKNSTSGSSSSKKVRSVLVAQRLSGMKAPSDDPKLEQIDMIPLGQSRNFCQNGTMYHPGDPEQEQHQQQQFRPYTMISRMRIEPLPESSKNPLMPPPDLVLQNKQFCEVMEHIKQIHSTLIPGMNDGEEIIHSTLLWRQHQDD